MNIAISQIDISGRSRKHLGDLKSLAASIERIGLLHPIVVDAENKLIVGRRRIAAYLKLGRDDIPARVARNIDELNLLLEAERDENTCREPYTPEEGVHLGRRMEALVAKLARAAQVEGGKRGGKIAGKGRAADRHGKSFPKPKRDESKRVPAQAAAAVGMSRPTYEKAKAVVDSKDRELIDEMNRTGKVNGAYKRMDVRKKAAAIKAEPEALPEGPFRVLVIDPPWKYGRDDDATHRGANPYPAMTIDEMRALPVTKRAHADSILWLWTTNAFMLEALELLDAWGFKQKTILTWAKDRMGLGEILRGQTEHCLVGVMGKPTVTLTNQTTLLHGPVREHSRKPEEFYHLVEALCPGNKLEMFAREKRAGWQQWGSESLK